MWAIVLEHPSGDPLDIEWVTNDELEAWGRVFELSRRLCRESGFVTAQRDMWITPWGSLREGLRLRFVLASGDVVEIRVGLEYRPDWVDDPEPFGDYFEPDEPF